MAWIVGDSFDPYIIKDDVARSVWDGCTIACFNLVSGATPTTRFGVGQACKSGSTLGLFFTKNIANESTIYAALAYYRIGILTGTSPEHYIQYRDGATPQCTVVFESSGNIVLKSGTYTGTVLATYTGAFVQDVWTHFQIRVVINNTTGEMTIRKNGQTSDTFTATGLNTRGGTANNYANVIEYGNRAANLAEVVDDLLFFTGSGAAPNTWTGDVRAICLSPANDTAQKNFTPLAASAQFTPAASAGNLTQLKDVLHIGGPFVAQKSGPCPKLSVTCNGAQTGNVQLALYDNDTPGGLAGTLLAATAVVTNPVNGVNDFTFSTPPVISQGHIYYVGLITDIAVGWSGLAAGSSTIRYDLARSYSLGFPNPAPSGMSTATFPPLPIFTVTGNVAMVSEERANGDTDYVYSSTVNDADLYDMADVPFTPQVVVGVVSKMYVKKSDAGARNGQVLMKSGATQVAGTDTVLSSTYTYISKVDTVDPNTGVAWTLPGVNAIQVGQKVTA